MTLAELLQSKFGDEVLSLQLIKPEIVKDINGLEPDKDKVFIKWEVAHTLPMINRNGLGLSLISAESSISSALHKSVNVAHQVIKNIPQGIEPPTDEDGRPVSLHVGHVVAATVEGPPENQKLAIPQKPRAIFFTTALFRQEPFVQAVLEDIMDAHVSGRDPFFQASVEYGRAGSFEDDLIFDGEKLFSIMDAPEELQQKFFEFDRRPIQHEGRVAGLVVGGNAGVVFSGLGITADPADVDTWPLEVAASNMNSDANAGKWLNLLICLSSFEGELQMFNEQWLEVLCSLGAFKKEDLERAKPLLAILKSSQGDKDDKQFTEAVNELTSILKDAKNIDFEKAIQEKVDEELTNGNYIKKDELASKLKAHVDELKEKGDIFLKEDFDKKLQEGLDAVNARGEKVNKWLGTLKEKEIDVEKLNAALKKSGQEKTVQERLAGFAGEENADELFEKSIGLFQMLYKGADEVNTDNSNSPVPQVGSRERQSESTKDVLDSFVC